jgi:hypothetical protein
MNKFTRAILEMLDRRHYGVAVMAAVRMVPDVYAKIKDRNDCWEGHADPLPMVKYLIRTCWNWDGVSLASIRQWIDPYSLVEQWEFTGQFSYAKEQGGFVPMGQRITCTRWLANVIEERQDTRIREAWAAAKLMLLSPQGSEPILIHTFHAQHLYFIQDTESQAIKIGISVHPEIRRKQLSAELRKNLQILFIIPSGGPEGEARLHQQFRSLRIHGEWFRPAPELLAYIEERRAAV